MRSQCSAWRGYYVSTYMFVSTVLLVLLLVASTFMGGNLNAVGGWRLESFDTRVPWYQIQINQEIPFQVKPQGWE